VFAILLCAAGGLWGAEPVALPGTNPLTIEGDLADKMMDGLHTFIERKIEQSVEKRARHWKRDASSEVSYAQSIDNNWPRFQRVIGARDNRVSACMERFGNDDNPALVAETERYRVYQVRWSVLEGVTGEGLLLEPKGREAVACVVALPDCDTTPEQAVGLAPGLDAEKQFARRLAENGFRVVIPTLIDRSDRDSGNPEIAMTNQPHREWIYRQAYHMGRHVIGYEVQKVLAAVDWLKDGGGPNTRKLRCAVAGYAEGGLIAFYAAAIDDGIKACLVSGYFQPRTRPWEEPLYRNVWGLLDEFGDAEIATLIAPRSLIVEHSEVPKVTGPPPVEGDRRGGAAVGKLTSPTSAEVQSEFERIGKLLPGDFQKRSLVMGEKGTMIGPMSKTALLKLAEALGVETPMTLSDELPKDGRKHFDANNRQDRQVKELEGRVQRLVQHAEQTRDNFFSVDLGMEPQPLDELTRRAPKMRKYLAEQVLGKFDDEYLPLNARTRRIYDNEKWSGYDVVLDVYRDVFAWGVLLMPKDIKPGEKRPVVVCQHGRNGVPRDTIEGNNKFYHDFAAKLADQGYIVFAPHNPYRGEDKYRLLSRKANAVKASLFSFILAQHEQILNWLEKLPEVDPKRIAFYGLSYGGETAVRIPALLDRYCLSICSADFNDWARKVASTDSKYSFMFTNEWEMPYFNMGNTFNYAELAALIAPRPFMVERGHDDPVAPDEWVAHEFAKVRRLYDQLDIGERTAMEVFNGGHTIHGDATFEFLRKQLKWPAK
jgi:dienelactone hydrolase